jgi:hypothetical protein
MNSLADRKKQLEDILESWDKILDDNDRIVRELKEKARQ